MGGVINAQTQIDLAEIGMNEFHRECAEVNAISRARTADANLKGAKISVANVRGKGSTTGIHATSKTPCTTCGPLIKKANLRLKR